jgi:hypothetical protein
VLRVYLPTCNRSDIKAFYGPIRRFLAEDDRTGDAVVFAHDPVRIKPKVERLA